MAEGKKPQSSEADKPRRRACEETQHSKEEDNSEGGRYPKGRASGAAQGRGALETRKGISPARRANGAPKAGNCMSSDPHSSPTFWSNEALDLCVGTTFEQTRRERRHPRRWFERPDSLNSLCESGRLAWAQTNLTNSIRLPIGPWQRRTAPMRLEHLFRASLSLANTILEPPGAILERLAAVLNGWKSKKH